MKFNERCVDHTAGRSYAYFRIRGSLRVTVSIRVTVRGLSLVVTTVVPPCTTDRPIGMWYRVVPGTTDRPIGMWYRVVPGRQPINRRPGTPGNFKVFPPCGKKFGEQKKPILFKVTESSSIPYRTPSACAKMVTEHAGEYLSVAVVFAWGPWGGVGEEMCFESQLLTKACVDYY